MLEQVLRHLNNWFLIDKHDGPFTVENGSITLPFLQEGQYLRVVGSVFNDGLHKYPAYELKNEALMGRYGRLQSRMSSCRWRIKSAHGRKRTETP